MFTWKPIYRELAERILEYKDRQGELIALLKEMEAAGLPVVSTTDKKDGTPQPLAEIDPFTFFASFNRHQTPDNRRSILAHISTKLGLAAKVPKDFDGIPIVNNMKSWFFPYVAKRQADDVSSLWQLAEQAIHNGPDALSAPLFDRCLQIAAVGPAKLTMGLFWLNPEKYIGCDKLNQKLFEAKSLFQNGSS